MRPQLPPAGAVLFVLTVNGPGSGPQLCLGEARNGGRRGKCWKHVIPIERGKYRAQYHHADGQPQDPRRNVIDLIEADIAFISKSHDVSPFLPFEGGDSTANDSTRIYHKANAFPGPGKGCATSLWPSVADLSHLSWLLSGRLPRRSRQRCCGPSGGGAPSARHLHYSRRVGGSPWGVGPHGRRSIQLNASARRPLLVRPSSTQPHLRLHRGTPWLCQRLPIESPVSLIGWPARLRRTPPHYSSGVAPFTRFI
jgi:hypothetical protein